MIEKQVIIITDGMTEDEIFMALNEDTSPLVVDLRTLVGKTIEQIIKERYDNNKASTIPEDSHRPDIIKIATD